MLYNSWELSLHVQYVVALTLRCTAMLSQSLGMSTISGQRLRLEIAVQYVVEEVLGAHGMINYVDARTAWMDDIVKQAQWQGITQVYPDDSFC